MTFRERLGNMLLGRAAVIPAVNPVRKASTLQTQLPVLTPQQSGRPIWTEWSTEQAIRGGLKASAWVYACVGKLADAASSVPWFVEQRTGEGKWERDLAHPLSNLLAQPNARMNRQDLFERAIYHLYLGGNALWHLVLVQGVPVEIEPMPVDRVKPVPSGNGYELEAYEYRMGSKKIPVPPEEVCHLQFVDPANPFWGLAPLQAAAQTVDTDVEAVRWNKVSLQNRAVTDGLFSFKHPMTDEQWETARKQIREQHMGADVAHTPWVLDSEATYQPMSLSPVEMDFLKTRQFNVAEICAVFRVPVVLISQERTTYNNMSTGRRMFWQDTIVPLLDGIAGGLDLRFTPYWNPEGLRDATKKTLRVGYDASGVPAMQEIWMEKAKTAREVWDMGVPFNQLNQRMELGFDVVPGGDLPFGGRPVAGAFGGGAAGGAADGNGGGKARPIRTKARRPSLTTPEEKAAFRHAFDRDRAKWEAKVADQVAAMYQTEGAEVAAAYEANGRAGMLRAIHGRQAQWAALWRPIYRAMIVHFGTLEGRRTLREVAAKAKGSRGPAFAKAARAWTLNGTSTAVDNFVRTTTGRKITEMTDTTITRLSQAIGEGLAAEETTPQIAGRIRDAYDDWAGEGDSPLDQSRSFVIARTEAGGASNFGHQEGARQIADETGAEISKEWISSDDDRTRDSHLPEPEGVGGEIVALDEPYSNGCMFPCDPMGPPEESIQCRCAESHTVEGLAGEETETGD
jgi:HK97 family phage portal protein